MKSLFNEYLALNSEGLEIDQKSRVFFKKLIAEHPEVNLRDFGTVVMNEISACVAEEVLRSAMKKRREERKNGTKP